MLEEGKLDVVLDKETCIFDILLIAARVSTFLQSGSSLQPPEIGRAVFCYQYCRFVGFWLRASKI